MNWKPTFDTTGLVNTFNSKQDLLLFWMFNDALIESGSPMDAWGMLFLLSGNCNNSFYTQHYLGQFDVDEDGVTYQHCGDSANDYPIANYWQEDQMRHRDDFHYLRLTTTEYGISPESTFTEFGSGIYFFYCYPHFGSTGFGQGYHYHC